MKNAVAKRRGRPRIADESASITLTLDATKLKMADEIAADLVVIAGIANTRGDVLRAALHRGLDAMHADIRKLAKR